ncbi:sulfatase-like hydrolase/transferase [Luteolibacter algae]|uniref:Sulfatase-like hydrolase/transferase n=1 Tax=Luteolibacter algae TaxID=454151 RepID=A0ABW5D6D8_9BACT
MKKIITLLLAAHCATAHAKPPEKPNIILIYADDISARELPVYGSSVWTDPSGHDTSDPKYRAETPVLDKLAEKGCWITNAWAATVCSPSRAMMMTGRYAHLHKWWHNGDLGMTMTKSGKLNTWPLYESSPLLIGHVAQNAGYNTYWAGKTQMKNSDLTKFGFDEGVFSPGEEGNKESPYSDFQIIAKKIDGKQVMIDRSTGKEGGLYPGSSYFWKPFVSLMNFPGEKSAMTWWPNTPETRKDFGVNTYAPDVELDYIFEFMERKKSTGKPFFIYHTSHLGHGYYDWFNPDFKSWPGTPKVKWDGKKYIRTEPTITKTADGYDTSSITEQGIHHHINYLDYQVWLYQNKLEEMGIAENTVLIFCADNGTSGYGKSSKDRQKGCHVPFIIYAPGMTKHGKQDVLLNLTDLLPTIADLGGYSLPKGYEINGESMVPFLYTDKPDLRDWVYAYNGASQLIRGKKVLKDGNEKWWDVDNIPEDLISFDEIKDWNSVSETHRSERDKLEKILPDFDLHEKEHDDPNLPEAAKKPSDKKKKKQPKPKKHN